jgi:hypothetical protein
LRSAVQVSLAALNVRRNMPRFQGDNLRRNLLLVEELKAHAQAENCPVRRPLRRARNTTESQQIRRSRADGSRMGSIK